MNRADQLAAEYLIRQVKRDAKPLPRFLNSPPVQDGPDRVSPLEVVAGFAVVAIVIFIFGWVL